MKPGRTWVPLDVGYLRDAAVARLRREHGRLIVAAWWPRVITLCKEGGASLVADVDLIEIADELGDERGAAKVAEMFRRMVELQLIKIVGGDLDDGLVSFRCVTDEEWQVPAGTKRSRKHREQAKTVAAQRDATRRNGVQRIATQGNAHTETETDTDTERETNNARKSPPRIAAPSAQDVEAQLAEARVELDGLSPGASRVFDQLVAEMAEANKTGKVSSARVLRELAIPLVDLGRDLAGEGIPGHVLREAMGQAAKAHAPNVNWVKKAAKGIQRRSAGEPALRHDTNGAQGGSLVRNVIHV